MFSTPQSAQQLLNNAQQLAGLTLAEIAEQCGATLPTNLLRDKGSVGLLLEQVLGADAGSKAEPDFTQIGIELKTLPVDRQGAPLESTFVCVAPMLGARLQQFEDSWVYQKLSHVLWVPILAERQIPLNQRMVGRAFLWQPTAVQLALLKQDWEELMELISCGRLAEIKGAHGQVLQLRPKGANAKTRTTAIGSDGQLIQALPRGFYLKTNFTRQILQQAYC